MSDYLPTPPGMSIEEQMRRRAAVETATRLLWEEIERGIRDATKEMYNDRRFGPSGVTLIARLIRLEITGDLFHQFISWSECPWVMQINRPSMMARFPRARIRGVDTYLVDDLPQPGWKVIGLSDFGAGA